MTLLSIHHIWAYTQSTLHSTKEVLEHLYLLFFIHSSKEMEPAQMSVNSSMFNEDIEYTHDGILLSYKAKKF